MITIEKTYGVRGVANEETLVRLQELIAITKEQYGWVGKAVIDAEKITFYKFGLKLGIARFATNGLVINESGIIRDVGFELPLIKDVKILSDLSMLLGKPTDF